MEHPNVAIVRRLLAALERGAPDDELFAIFHPAIEHVELPSRVLPQGRTSDAAAMRAASARGRALMASQRYVLRSAIADGDRVAAEVGWEGTLAVALGTLPAGHVMRGHLAIFFEIEDGRIRRQRNYDCYEPW